MKDGPGNIPLRYANVGGDGKSILEREYIQSRLRWSNNVKHSPAKLCKRHIPLSLPLSREVDLLLIIQHGNGS
ncbi:hypothetical protein RvY_18293 [Ramazzottius varieornatus]|uniref:Uncharacterized protein n=1 Tax=Ramazzottius varieornatus TaxID=947166 RepID=A0A1D1WAZ6_RAMVA|nr:hypothetical protein RvY_18293 [Ramazzottius varieornatus]